jgi:hypothetical protein
MSDMPYAIAALVCALLAVAITAWDTIEFIRERDQRR